MQSHPLYARYVHLQTDSAVITAEVKALKTYHSNPSPDRSILQELQAIFTVTNRKTLRTAFLQESGGLTRVDFGGALLAPCTRTHEASRWCRAPAVIVFDQQSKEDEEYHLEDQQKSWKHQFLQPRERHGCKLSFSRSRV